MKKKINKLIEKIEVSDNLLITDLEWLGSKNNSLENYGEIVRFLLKKITELETKIKHQ